MSSKTSVRVRIGIVTHENVDIIFYPMIRPASIKDSTYVPYAMTNRELTEVKFYNSSQLGAGISAAKHGKVATLLFGITTQISGSANSWATITTLPRELWPAITMRFVAYNNQASKYTDNIPYQMWLDSYGNLKVWLFSDKTYAYPEGCLTYITRE